MTDPIPPKPNQGGELALRLLEQLDSLKAERDLLAARVEWAKEISGRAPSWATPMDAICATDDEVRKWKAAQAPHA